VRCTHRATGGRGGDSGAGTADGAATTRVGETRTVDVDLEHWVVDDGERFAICSS
jgi:hypothetical protein